MSLIQDRKAQPNAISQRLLPADELERAGAGLDWQPRAIARITDALGIDRTELGPAAKAVA